MSTNKKEITLSDIKNISRNMPKTFLSPDGRKILYQPVVSSNASQPKAGFLLPAK